MLAHQFIDGLHHVHRDPNGPRLVGDGPGDGLTNPPSGIGAELVTLAVIELFHGPNQTDVTLLDHVQQGHAPADVFLGDADHQPQVSLGQVGPCPGALGVDPGEVSPKQRVHPLQLGIATRLI